MACHVFMDVIVMGFRWVCPKNINLNQTKKTLKTVANIGFQGFWPVPPVGFEPTTHDLKGRCSNR